MVETCYTLSAKGFQIYGGPHTQTLQTVLQTQQHIFLEHNKHFSKHKTVLSKHNKHLSKHNTVLLKLYTIISKHNTIFQTQIYKLANTTKKLRNTTHNSPDCVMQDLSLHKARNYHYSTADILCTLIANSRISLLSM